MKRKRKYTKRSPTCRDSLLAQLAKRASTAPLTAAEAALMAGVAGCCPDYALRVAREYERSGKR